MRAPLRLDEDGQVIGGKAEAGDIYRLLHHGFRKVLDDVKQMLGVEFVFRGIKDARKPLAYSTVYDAFRRIAKTLACKLLAPYPPALVQHDDREHSRKPSPRHGRAGEWVSSRWIECRRDARA